MNRSRLLTALVVALLLLAGCSGDHKGASSDAGEVPEADPNAAAAQALDLQMSWNWVAPETASAGMPAADGEGVALTSGRRRITLFDPAGKVRWQVDHAALRDVAPALIADSVLAATEESLVSFDRATGRQRWETSVSERVNTPVVAGGRAVVTTWEGSMMGVDLADGRIAWRQKLGGEVLGPAAAGAAAAGTGPGPGSGAVAVAVATFDSGRAAGAVAVDVATGRARWTVPLPANGVSGPAVVGDTVVMVGGDVAAHGLSLQDGSERWRRPLGGSGSPEVPPLPQADGTVLVAHRHGGVALVDGRDGSVRWEASSDSVAVRGGPAGPGPHGWFALPLNDGTVLMAGPDREADVRDPPGRVSGVASGPGGVLLVARAQGADDGLDALSGW